MSAVEVHHEELRGSVLHDDAPVVVLSNALGSDLSVWDAQVGPLADRFRVVRYDTRGHGLSPVPDGPYSLDDLVDDLVALLDRLGIQRAHVAGLSLGGMTGMRLAAREPDRVDRLALLCTAGEMSPASGWTDRAATVRSRGAGAVASGSVARWFTADFRAAHPGRVAAYEQMVAATPAEGYAGCCEAIAATDLLAAGDLPRITAPSLAVAGTDDPSTPPARLEQIVDQLPDARLLVVPQAAHLANAEQPDTVTRALIEHFGADEEN